MWDSRAMVTLFRLCSGYTLLRLFLYVLPVILLLILAARRRSGNQPPGPVGLPVLGYLPFLGKVAHRKLHELSGKYGPVFSLYLGRRLVVVLNNIESVREALSNPDIMDRPTDSPSHLLPNSTSLSMCNGAVWKEQRTFAVKILRSYGMGKAGIETRVQVEIQGLEGQIDAHGGNPMNFTHLVTPSVSNVLLAFLTAKEDSEGRWRAIIGSALQTLTLYTGPTMVHAYFPWLLRWMVALKIWGYDQMEKTIGDLADLIVSEIEYHRRTLDPDNVRDYIDEFLLAAEKRKSTFTDTMLRGNVQTLLGAGSAPSRATIEWCIVTVATYPDIQDRVYQELSEVLESERPTWASRHETPYTMAVILEVMRYHTTVPISMLRTNTRPCHIGGFDVPADTIIMPNIYGVHHDAKHWDRPDDFWPERFLRDGKLFKPPAFIPFSYGRRNCPGEDLAWVEIYLYFVSLVQRYNIVLPQESKRRCFKPLLGITNMVVIENIQMVRRT